jgi:5-carboxymethyl-2-hydroxymuconate isomerase
MIDFNHELCACDGSFVFKDCKSRVIDVETFYIDEQHGFNPIGYVHIDVYMLKGRSKKTRQFVAYTLSEWTMNRLKEAINAPFELTFNITELDPHTYVKKH